MEMSPDEGGAELALGVGRAAAPDVGRRRLAQIPCALHSLDTGQDLMGWRWSACGHPDHQALVSAEGASHRQTVAHQGIPQRSQAVSISHRRDSRAYSRTEASDRPGGVSGVQSGKGTGALRRESPVGLATEYRRACSESGPADAKRDLRQSAEFPSACRRHSRAGLSRGIRGRPARRDQRPLGIPACGSS